MIGRLPGVLELETRIDACIEAEDYSALEIYMEQLWPVLMRASERWPKPKRISHSIGRAYEELVLQYRRQAIMHVENEARDSYHDQEAMGKLRTLEEHVLSLAHMMGWSDVRQRVSYSLGEVYETLGDIDAAERHFRVAAACSESEVTAGWALQALASIWRHRDIGMAAYFYRWAAELDSTVPAIPYVHLYCCLILAGRRDEVVAEMQACEGVSSKSLRDLMQLAAAKQVLGLEEEAEAVWAKCLQQMPSHPLYCAPGAWEQHVKAAKVIRCDDSTDAAKSTE